MDNFVADFIFVDSPPERVFAGLLEPADVEVWMDAEKVQVEPHVGGAFDVECADGSRLTATVAKIDRPSELELREVFWHDGDSRRGPMHIRFRLEPHMGGVRFHVRQGDLDCVKGWERYANAVRESWRHRTVSLKRHIDEI
jgi:uncharacterized protein YndB with AHSA1/START domain